jgi:hypothetical protein
MLDLIKLKKITSTTALALLMASTLGVQAGFSNNGNGNGNNNTPPGQAKKICKNNNGIGNNYDVEYTLRNETFSIRIDPGNNGQMNKFKADLTSRGYTTAEVNDAASQIIDAEMQFKNSNGNNANCPSSTVSSGSDYSTLYANMSDFSFYREATDKTNFHTTVYGTQGTGVAAFQQFVNKEREALNLTELNARKLDASKLTLSQAQDVKIYFINEGAGYRNQLKLETLGSTLLNGMIFKDASVGNATNELRVGDYVGLGTLAAGTTLDFQLRANGAANANPNVWYGDIDRNSDKIQHVIAYEYQGYLVLAWEDLKGGGDNDYNDIVFAIDIGRANLAAIPNEPPANQPPAANPDTTTTLYPNPVTINVLANDSDPENSSLTINSVSSITGATVAIVRGQNGQNDRVKYTPKSRFSGTDYFSYTIKDNRNLTSSATVTVTVNPRATNNPPVAVNDVTTTPYQTEKTINVKNNDRDPDGDPLTIIFNQPLNGKVRFDSSKSKVIYTPSSGYSGVDTFTYQVADIDEVNSNTATVTVTVGPRPNSLPVAVNDTQTTLENTNQTINVTANDSDPDTDAINIFKLNGQAVSADTWVTLPSGAKIQFNSNNQVVYDPNGKFNSLATDETATDTFQYSISDGYGGESSATVAMTIEGVTPNTVPTTANDSLSTNEDAATIINVLSNDTDADNDTLSVAQINGTSVQVGSRIYLSNDNSSFLTLNDNGTITYNPNNKFNSLNNQQTGTETFTYSISDGRGGTSTATVTVTINGITNTTTD